MNDNFAVLTEQLRNKTNMCLVTIIDEAGSSPRGTGSQMLVGTAGQLCGTIGGGAVEKRSEEYAMELIAEKKSDVRKFELHRDATEDIGMACGGDVIVMFQFIDASDEYWNQLASELVRMVSVREAGWLIQKLDGSVPALVDKDGNYVVRKLEGCSCGYAEATINKALIGAGCKLSEETCLFSMPLPVGERVILFGGGHVAKALAPIIHSVGFRLVVMDEREEFVTEDRFPMAERRIVGDFSKLNEYLNIEEDDYVIVMTNGHAHDYDVEEQVLRKNVSYIGVIGSAKKTTIVNDKLREAGISDDVIATVHAPIGIDIKSSTPEEIAISVTGELILVRAEKREKLGKLTQACPMH